MCEYLTKYSIIQQLRDTIIYYYDIHIIDLKVSLALNNCVNYNIYI